MPMYRTTYTTHTGRQHSTSCYARDPDHLAETIARRRMGETWHREGYGWGSGETPKMPSYHLERGELAAANHALMWVGMIAVRSDVADQWAMLNDDGLLHELAHVMHTVEFCAGTRGGRACPACLSAGRDLARKVERFERLVPGVHPCWAGEDTRPHRSREYVSPMALLERTFNDVAVEVVRQQLDTFAGGIVAKAADTFSLARLLDSNKPRGPRGDPAKRGADRQQLEQREAALQSRRRAVLEAAKPKRKADPAGFATGGVVKVGDREIGRPISIEITLDRPLAVRKPERVFFGLDLAGRL